MSKLSEGSYQSIPGSIRQSMHYSAANHEISLLSSYLTTQGCAIEAATFQQWFRIWQARMTMTSRAIPFAEMDQWRFAGDPLQLVHSSGKFFSVVGLRIQAAYSGLATWDQPIIDQPEVGILGLITKHIHGVPHFLMQAKIEPGNVNGLQLSPTVQATKSNYTRVHGGQPTAYLEYFTQPGRSSLLVDLLQAEHGAYYLRKFNRNIVVAVTDDLPLLDGFCWLTLGQIHQLLHTDNLVNMDSRSVLSCILAATRFQLCSAATSGDGDHLSANGLILTGFGAALCHSMLDHVAAVHSTDELFAWLNRLQRSCTLSITQVPLDQMQGWRVESGEILDAAGEEPSVISVAVNAGNREVEHWTQPLLKRDDYALLGFLCQRIGGTLHFLVQATIEPGQLGSLELGPTVVSYGASRHLHPDSHPLFEDWFLAAADEHIRFSAIQSEEGGRFYHFQSRYMIVELPSSATMDVPPTFTWMTLGQLLTFMERGHISIEARNLLACLSLDDTTLKPSTECAP